MAARAEPPKWRMTVVSTYSSAIWSGRRICCSGFFGRGQDLVIIGAWMMRKELAFAH